MHNNTITLLFAGDFIPPETDSNLYSEELQEVLKDKDYSLVNLETPLTNGNQPIEKLGNNFKRSPKAIKHIKDGFFDAVTLSNNHIRDFGDEGVLDTLKNCREHNIQTAGAGKNLNEAAEPLRLNIKGKKISILNYSEREFNIASEDQAGANPYDTITAYYEIQKEKQENDFVIVVYHGGLEYQYYPTPEMVRNFKFMVDAGADAVVSHHTHRYSGSMVYNGVPILFGLGNFLFQVSNKVRDDWYYGLLTKIYISEDKIDHEIIPVRMKDDFEKVHCLDEHEAKKINKHFKEIANNILKEEFLTDYWRKVYKKNNARIINQINSNSRFTYRIRKYFFGKYCSKISSYKRLLLLNMLRCDSHRRRLIHILENKL